MKPPFWLHPSGGIRYHLRAAIQLRSLWAPFRRSLGRWLSEWRPNFNAPLILFGPSGGYVLDPEFLKRFPSLLVIEPDPIARWIFQMRFKHLNLRINFLKEPIFQDRPDFPKTLEMIHSLPRASSFLFCNLLGQLHLDFQGTDPALFEEEVRDFLHKTLTQRTWASFHDRFSVDWEESSMERVEIQDHIDLAKLSSNAPSYFLWNLGARQNHLIQAIAVSQGFD